jgi:flagellar biosynthesis protein FliP
MLNSFLSGSSLAAMRELATQAASAIGYGILRPRNSSALNWSGLGGSSGSVPWNIVVLLTLLTLLPALLVAVTPFTRLLIVFHFLRQALGTQTAPSNQTLIGLALVLTYFLMQPVGAAIYQLFMPRPSCPFSKGRWMPWARSNAALRRYGISC